MYYNFTNLQRMKLVVILDKHLSYIVKILNNASKAKSNIDRWSHDYPKVDYIQNNLDY